MSSIFAMDRSGSETPDGPDRVAIVRPVGHEFGGMIGCKCQLSLVDRVSVKIPTSAQLAVLYSRLRKTQRICNITIL